MTRDGRRDWAFRDIQGTQYPFLTLVSSPDAGNRGTQYLFLTLASSPDGRTIYNYDDADRLVKIERRTATGAPQGFSEFVYDYASRKAISREWTYQNGTFVKTEEKRRVFDGMDVVQERNAANEVTAQLVRDGNISGILSRTTAAGAAFYGYDGNGNVTLLTDASGADVAHYRYDAWGNTLEAVGPRAGENPYRFSTKEVHAASGLIDFGLRFYSPSMGRWINRDPLGEEGGINLYAMVGNSPVNGVDEYGLDPYPCTHPNFNGSAGACPSGSENTVYSTRGEAWHATKDRADVPRSQAPVKQWTVGGDNTRKGHRNYLYSKNKSSWGRYYQYETHRGTRVVVEHTSDIPYKPHMHAGQPKGVSNRRVDMKNQERYGQVGRKHHNYYNPRGRALRGLRGGSALRGLGRGLGILGFGLGLYDALKYPNGKIYVDPKSGRAWHEDGREIPTA